MGAIGRTWSNGPSSWISTCRKLTRRTLHVTAYAAASTLVEVLKRCGDNLTRANVMKQAASLKNLEVPMLLPGIKINTSPTDFYPI